MSKLVSITLLNETLSNYTMTGVRITKQIRLVGSRQLGSYKAMVSLSSDNPQVVLEKCSVMVAANETVFVRVLTNLDDNVHTLQSWLDRTDAENARVIGNVTILKQLDVLNAGQFIDAKITVSACSSSSTSGQPVTQTFAVKQLYRSRRFCASTITQYNHVK